MQSTATLLTILIVGALSVEPSAHQQESGSCPANRTGDDDTSLLSLHSPRPPLSAEQTTAGCPDPLAHNGLCIQVQDTIFQNNCAYPLQIKHWDCVVPPHTTCALGVSCWSSLQAGAALNATSLAEFSETPSNDNPNGKPICGDATKVNPSIPKPSQPATTLEWIFPQFHHPNGDTNIVIGDQIETTVGEGYLGRGTWLNRPNFKSHAGWTASKRLEVIETGTNAQPKPICNDYGMESSLDFQGDPGNFNSLNCPGPAITYTKLPLDNHKRPFVNPAAGNGCGGPCQCNGHLCGAAGGYYVCQSKDNGQYIFDNMAILMDGGYKCRSMCYAYRDGGEHILGCGQSPAYPNSIPTCPDETYTDLNGAFTRYCGLGILSDPKTCQKQFKKADYKVTTCGIPQPQVDAAKCHCAGSGHGPGGGPGPAGCPSGI